MFTSPAQNVTRTEPLRAHGIQQQHYDKQRACNIYSICQLANNSFSLYGPPSLQITYRNIFARVVRDSGNQQRRGTSVIAKLRDSDSSKGFLGAPGSLKFIRTQKLFSAFFIRFQKVFPQKN